MKDSILGRSGALDASNSALLSQVLPEGVLVQRIAATYLNEATDQILMIDHVSSHSGEEFDAKLELLSSLSRKGNEVYMVLCDNEALDDTLDDSYPVGVYRALEDHSIGVGSRWRVGTSMGELRRIISEFEERT